MGEGSGADADLMPLITSANIACGGHAGDESTMRASVLMAAAHGVSIGAHPSYPDRAGFGRLSMTMAPGRIEREVEAQLRALAAAASRAGTSVRHVKPHGALYNQAASDRELAVAIGRAVQGTDPSLIVVALSGSAEVNVLQQMGLRVAREAFVDRGYEGDGRLVPREAPGALVTDAHLAAVRAVRLVRDHTLTAVDGTELEIFADTLCIHSDTPGSVDLARTVRSSLLAAGVGLAPMADVLGMPEARSPRSGA